jgi:putative ABC transport system permease protein
VKLVIISFVIASPVAWWLMNSWLPELHLSREYRLAGFVITSLASLSIAIFTVSFQAIKRHCLIRWLV